MIKTEIRITYSKSGVGSYQVKVIGKSSDRFPNGVDVGIPLGTREAAEDFAKDVGDYFNEI